MNMEDIMMMNQRLRPYQEKSREVDEDNFAEKCENIEKLLGSIDDDSELLKELEDNVNQNIESSTNEYYKFLDNTYSEFSPELLVKYKYLKTQIKDQKDENASLLKQIDLLNQEITLIFENIVKLGNRLNAVEKFSGIEKDFDDNESDY
jgi:hypothetical protein